MAQAMTPNELAASRPGNNITGPAQPNTNPYGKMDYSTNPNGVRIQNAPGVTNLNTAPQAVPASTTTASNVNKITAVPKIQQTTQNLSQGGTSLNSSGATTYANGTLVQPPAGSSGPQTDENGNQLPQKPGTYTNYLGQLQTVRPGTPPAGSTVDGNGNYVGPDGTPYAAPAGDSSYQFSQIFNNINTLKSQVSSQLATTLDNITAQYQNLTNLQTQANTDAEKFATNSLVMAGAIGSGSAASTMQYVINNGIQKLSTLQTQMQTAVSNAQNAALTENIQLQDQYNKVAQDIADNQQAIATKLQEDMQTAQIQAQRDTAVASVFLQGTTNPADILKTLQSQGNDDITLDDINTAIKSIVPPEITSILDTATKNGLTDPATIKAISSATSVEGAIKAAGDYLQSATGDMGTYLDYKRNAESNGQSPESFEAWQKANDQRTQNQEYGKAFAAEAGKQAADNQATKNANNVLQPVTSDSGLTYNVPASVAPYVKIAPNGVKYIDASGLTPAEKGKIKVDAYNNGTNPIPVITDPSFALDVSNINDATLKLQDMKTAFDAQTAGNAAERDTYFSAAIKMASALQTNPDAAALDTYQDTALDILKAMSGTKGFRGGTSMVDQVKATFPKKTDTQDVVDQKIANMQKLIDDRQTGLIGKPNASDQLIIDGKKADDTIKSIAGQGANQQKKINDDADIFQKTFGKQPTSAELLQAFPELTNPLNSNPYQ